MEEKLLTERTRCATSISEIFATKFPSIKEALRVDAQPSSTTLPNSSPKLGEVSRSDGGVCPTLTKLRLL